MTRRRLLAVAACAALLIPGAASSLTIDTPVCIVRKSPPKVGIWELSRTTVDERLLDIRVHSDAMQGPQPLHVLLPTNYDPSGATRYPVLYLLHGALDTYESWPAHGVADVIGDRQMIVVMPDDLRLGSYADWYGMVAGDPRPIPSLETYHIEELIPYIDSTFPTVAGPSGRFVAGLSSGGSGTYKYAAANPGLFGAAGGFSAAVHITIDYPFYPTINEVLWAPSAIPGYGPLGFCTFGDPYTQQAVWEDNNPNYLAENLRGIPLFLATGDGNAGEYDDGPTYDPVEGEVYAMNKEFVATLDALGIPHTDEFYGGGTHSWPYWLRDLDHFLTWLEPNIGQPVTAPAGFAYRSARKTFSAWGWDFTVQRGVREFVYLSGVSAAGLVVTGSGIVGVMTAPLYSPGGSYAITGASPATAIADAAGRLHLVVDLGPSHTLQQYDFGPDAAAGWVRRTVTIAGL